MTRKGTILVVGSNAKRFALRDGKSAEVGYLNELAIPTQAAVDAGYDAVLATPTGAVPVMDPQSNSPHHFGGSVEALEKALTFVRTYPGFQKPRSLRSVIEENLDEYAGIFVPGGHPPMIDLMQDGDLGEVLRHFHAAGKPTVLLCHGPIAATAAMPKAREFRAALVAGDVEAARAAAAGWQYAGYRMTVFSDDEERWAEENLMNGAKVPFYVYDALEIAGGKLEKAPGGIFKPHLVQDRELITGQNPPSDHIVAERLVHALDAQTSAHAA